MRRHGATKTGGESKQKIGLDDPLNHIVISIIDHGCRSNSVIQIPDRVWVISRCDDVVGWTSGLSGRKANVLSTWIPYVSNNGGFTLTEKFTELIKDASDKDRTIKGAESLTWGKYFCVNCPNSSIYDIELARTKVPTTLAGLYAPFDLDLNSKKFDTGDAYYKNNPLHLQKFLLRELGDGPFGKTVVKKLVWKGINSLDKLEKKKNIGKLVNIITEVSNGDPHLLQKAEVDFSRLLRARTKNIENTVQLGQVPDKFSPTAIFPTFDAQVLARPKGENHAYKLSRIFRTIQRSQLYTTGKNFVIFLPTPCTLFCYPGVTLRSSTGLNREEQKLQLQNKKINIRKLVKNKAPIDKIEKMVQEYQILQNELNKIGSHKCADDVQTQCLSVGRPRLDSWLKHGIDKCRRVDDPLNKVERTVCAKLFEKLNLCVGSKVELASPDYTLDTLLLQINAPPMFLARLENLGITNLNKFINFNLAQNTKLWYNPLNQVREWIVVLWDKISDSMKLYLNGLDGVSSTDFNLVEKFNPIVLTTTILGFEGRFIKLGLPFIPQQLNFPAGIPYFHPWNPRGIDNRTATHEYAYDEQYTDDGKIKKIAQLTPIQKEWGAMPTGHRGILLITYEAFIEALRLGALIKSRELLARLKQTESTTETGGEQKMQVAETLPLPPGKILDHPITQSIKYFGGVTLKEKPITDKSFNEMQKRFNTLPKDYDFIPGKIVEILLLPAAKQKWVKAKLIENIGKSPHGEDIWVAEYKKNGQDIRMRVRESRIRIPSAIIPKKKISVEDRGKKPAGPFKFRRGGRRKKKRTRKKKNKRRKTKTRKRIRKTKKKRR